MKKILSKKDVFFAFLIGEACAVIFILIRGFLGLPDLVNKIIIIFPFLLPVLAIAGLFFTALLGKKWPSLFQAGKNILVGTLNSSIDIGILNFLMLVTGLTQGTIILLFKAISFTSSSVNSYFWNKFWTFEHEKATKTGEFVKFYSIALGGLIIHQATIYTTVNLIGPKWGASPIIWVNLANALAIFLGFFWNFLGYKLLIFKK